MKLKAILMTLVMALCAYAADVTGKWKASAQGPDGDMQITFDLKQDGAKVSGTAESPMGPMQISEGKVEGDQITFTVKSDQFEVVHKGTISGDEMKLKVDVGDRTMEMTAKRVKE